MKLHPAESTLTGLSKTLRKRIADNFLICLSFNLALVILVSLEILTDRGKNNNNILHMYKVQFCCLIVF